MSDDTLAGATNTGTPDEIIKEAREVHPILLDKSLDLGFEKDFRPTPEEDEPAPKVSSVQGSAIRPTSATGLEDVSVDDLENLVKKDVKKETNAAHEKGKPTSSSAT